MNVASEKEIIMQELSYRERWINRHSVYQVSVIDALMQGVMEGVISVKELLCRGDFGIGTFEGIDGELVVLDGTAYVCKDDGTVEEALPEKMVSFAQVTCFDRFAPLHRIEGIGNREEMEEKIGEWTLEDPNIIYAIRGHVDDAAVEVRSIGKQEKPYPTLLEAAKAQKVFHMKHVSGTLLGFLFPRFMTHVNIPFWHFHFLADDLSCGGHLLDIQSEVMNLQVYPIFEHAVRLPEGKAFSRICLCDTRDMEKAMRDTEE